MNSKLEALMTDLDGSLLNDHKEIGKEDAATLGLLQRKGVQVFFATGRHQCLTRIYAPCLAPDTPTVTSNGGLIYSFAEEKILSMSPLERQDVATLLDFTRKHGLAHYLYTDRLCVLNASNPDSRAYKMDLALSSIALPHECITISPAFNPLEHTIIKYMIPDCPAHVVAELESSPLGRSGRITWAYSGEDFLDINAGGISKGSALRQLAAQYGFSLENTLAMGDNFNDREMLETAVYSVIPETAREDLRPYARFVTCSNNHNPITHAVRTLFPGLLEK